MRIAKRYPPIAFILTSALFLSLFCAGCRQSPPGDADNSHPEGNGLEPNSVRLTEEAVRKGGIAVEPACILETVRSIAGVGELRFNGRRLAHLTARASGRIESIAAFGGESVIRGQALAEIYSREYLALQSEVLQAAERAARLRGMPDGQAAQAILDAARSNLLPLGVTEEEIDSLITEKSIRPFLIVRAPFDGRIIEQAAVTGDRVELGTSLFRLADLSMLWGSIRIYEKDLTGVRPGAEVTLHTQAFPGEEFRGRLVLIGPLVDEKTRTIEGRVEVPNPKERLKPGMYVDVSIASGEIRPALVIPESALQEFQSQSVVFVRTAPGTYELRLVEAGERTGGRAEIVKGLAEGDEVVTAGSFLLKSEFLKKTMGDEHGHD